MNIKLLNEKSIILRPLNSRILSILTDSYVIEEFDSLGNDIKKLIISNIEYKIGDTIEVPSANSIKFKYKINHIEKIGEKNYLLIQERVNKTTTYILPIIGFLNAKFKDATGVELHEEVRRYMYKTYMINSYLSSENKNELNLVYRFSDNHVYIKFEESIKTHPEYIRKEDIGDYTIFVFNIKPKFDSEIEKFKDGLYSHFEPSFKNTIIRFHKFTIDSVVYQILEKSEKLKKVIEGSLGDDLPDGAELDSLINEEDEYIEHFKSKLYD